MVITVLPPPGGVQVVVPLMLPPDQLKPSDLQLPDLSPANRSPFGPLASSGVMQVRVVEPALAFMPSLMPGGRPSAAMLTTSVFISHSPGWRLIPAAPPPEAALEPLP